MLAAQTHLGSKNVSAKMKKYVFSRREDGIHIMNLGILWEKLVLAARIIVAVENPKDVCIVSSCANGRRAALKFAEYVGTTCLIDRHIPGTFTNTTVKGYTEPLLLISTDPFNDAQVLRESQYCNLPVIALTNITQQLEKRGCCYSLQQCKQILHWCCHLVVGTNCASFTRLAFLWLSMGCSGRYVLLSGRATRGAR
jgi:small subunit ribosomal protein SAe